MYGNAISMRLLGNPPPRYEEIGGSFSVTLPRKKVIPNIISKQETQVALRTLTVRQKKILNILKTGSLNRRQIMAKMKTKIPERTLQLELAKLRDLGLITSEGKARTVVWILR